MPGTFPLHYNGGHNFDNGQGYYGVHQAHMAYDNISVADVPDSESFLNGGSVFGSKGRARPHHRYETERISKG